MSFDIKLFVLNSAFKDTVSINCGFYGSTWWSGHLHKTWRLGFFLGVRVFAEIPGTDNRINMMACSLHSPHTLGAPPLWSSFPLCLLSTSQHLLLPSRGLHPRCWICFPLCAESCEHPHFRVTLGALSWHVTGVEVWKGGTLFFGGERPQALLLSE